MAGMVEVRWDNVGSCLADGVDAMLQADWAEVESDTDLIPYNPDWDRAFALERQGILKVLSARIGGKLIGLNSFMVMDYFHSKGVLHAFNDLIYVTPTHRGTAGVRLIRAAEPMLKALGVVRVFYAWKPRRPEVGALLEKLGYHHFETIMLKAL